MKLNRAIILSLLVHAAVVGYAHTFTAPENVERIEQVDRFKPAEFKQIAHLFGDKDGEATEAAGPEDQPVERGRPGPSAPETKPVNEAEPEPEPKETPEPEPKKKPEPKKEVAKKKETEESEEKPEDEPREKPGAAPETPTPAVTGESEEATATKEPVESGDTGEAGESGEAIAQGSGSGTGEDGAAGATGAGSGDGGGAADATGSGTNGGGGTDSGVDRRALLAKYGPKLHRAIARHKHYPRLALRSGLEGVVYVKVVVDTDGRVLKVKLAKSSGHRILDQAALKTVRSMERLPKPPGGLAKVPLNIPVRYRKG